MPDAHCDLWFVGCGDINCSYTYYAQYILWNIETTEITYQTSYIWIKYSVSIILMAWTNLEDKFEDLIQLMFFKSQALVQYD